MNVSCLHYGMGYICNSHIVYCHGKVHKVGWLVSGFLGFLVVCLFGWLFGWMVGCLVASLVGRMVGWLVG